jgi:FAD dependent oxidoreductase
MQPSRDGGNMVVSDAREDSRSPFMLQRTLAAIALLSACWSFAAEAGDVIEADVCIYGGTSGGVVAAVQATRMGKRVVLAEPGKNLGGMTAGGLSAVDIGDPRSIGGITREYFTKLVGRYGKTLAWDRPFESKGGPATGGAFAIEPHTAEQLFEELLREAKAPVHFGARLAGVRKEGPRIVELVTEDGTMFRAKVFIDATYEGDLLAKAGVSYTLMREGNARYGETYNGIHYTDKYQPRTDHKKPGANGRVPGGQGVWDRDFPLDPYVLPGNPSSGLLPLVQAGEPGRAGEPAPGVQAYCFRLCLTTADDRIAIAPPSDYDPRRYELVARFIAACQAIGDDLDLRWFSKYDPLPNQKWDFNTATFGGNLPGASRDWPEATYAGREQIAKEHENYHRGLLHFLATDPRVPAKVRDEMRRFGLPRDEFTASGGWPHQLYIREARRMVSDLVLTEHHTFGRQVAPQPVSLGSYGTDTHEIRRIVKDGVVIREGKTAIGRGRAPPYPIGYGAIVPKASECENLLVTFALSASHTAFSSIRMEPVFMATSQSAATAACLAIDAGGPVQQVDYEQLRSRLLADNQVLTWKVGR